MYQYWNSSVVCPLQKRTSCFSTALLCPRLTPCLAPKTHSVCLTPSDRLYTRNLVFNSKNTCCLLPLHVLQTLASNALVSPADTQYSREALVRFAQTRSQCTTTSSQTLVKHTFTRSSLGDLLTVALHVHSNYHC